MRQRFRLYTTAKWALHTEWLADLLRMNFGMMSGSDFFPIALIETGSTKTNIG